MELLERIGVIAEIARQKQGRSGRLGKTAVMKLIYLLQEAVRVPVGYRFTLYTYGPYQSDVMSDIDAAEALGAIKIEYDDDQGYRIGIGPRSSDFPCPSAAKSPLADVIRRFGDMTARELELRSTILYLSLAVPRPQLAENVRQVKPRFSLTEISSTVDELRKQGLLRSTVGGN